MWISDTSGHGHGDNNGDNSGDNSGDKSGDKSGEKCVNKRCGGISPTLYAVQYIVTALRGALVFNLLSVVCCLYVTFLLPVD